MLTTKDGDMAKALVSGGCVISGEINFDYRTFFLNNGVLSHSGTHGDLDWKLSSDQDRDDP